MSNPIPKPAKRKTYAARKAAHMREFEANSLSRWTENEGLCEQCGEYVPMKTPAHHIQAAGKGGFRDNSIENLATICGKCHNDETDNRDKHERTGRRDR